MSHYLAKKSTLKGTLSVPASKSHTLRAILFASLADGISTIHSYLSSKDTDAMINAVKSMGAEVEVFPDRLEITGTSGKVGPFEDVVQAGNSGIVLRFMAALGGLSTFPLVVTGDHSIRHQRPMKQLVEALKLLGASVKSMRGDNYAPLIIQGPMLAPKTELSGEDSQPVSALLIAAAFKNTPTEITVKNPGEKPWVGLTLHWFDRLGIAYQNLDFEHYTVKGRANYSGFEYTVPGDFSSAAFPIVAALITNSPLTIENLEMGDPQGDKELIAVLQRMGAKIEIDPFAKKLTVSPGSQLKGIDVNINNFIDAVTILATIACYAEGETRITGAEVAREKESNRLLAISTELTKMGAKIQETPEGLIIKKSPLRGASLYSYNDHRMCMSLAVAAMGAEGTTTIHSTECVNKTYPDFLAEFQRLGASIHA